jgi:predicted AlkP superfamily phosphohydrolase/phosphomutase
MRTLIIGLDAFDPIFFEALASQGKLPHLSKFIERKGYSPFQVSNPPQSEVSWTSIATGLDPSAHGMFDFVHRDPQTYALHVSLLPTGKALGGVQFVRPYNARTIFDMAAERGFPSTSLWWPATFPARPESPVRSLPGLGTPDIQGRLGVGMLFSSESGLAEKQGKTPVRPLQSAGASRYRAALEGPQRQTSQGPQSALLEMELLLKDDTHAELRLGKQVLTLELDRWSPIIEISFKMGLLVNVHAITRLILTQTRPAVRLYALPLQIHPLHALWRYGTPASFVKEAWTTAGPFLTLGWPQDTTGLEDGCISDQNFLDLCDSIVAAREKLLMHQLDGFKEGLLASVFDSMDRVQHMFWRDRPDLIEGWYEKLDGIVGKAIAKNGSRPPRLLIVSDHGFKNFDFKVNLNRWLIDEGFLTPDQPAPEGDLKGVDWSRSPAYAVGLNSLYLNLAGREGQGCVPPAEREQVSETIRRRLLDWKGPDGRPVVQQVYPASSNTNGGAQDGGLLAAYGPDMLVGYTPGYRASAETGLGAWKAAALEPNRDHWGADHCFDPQSVPGVLFYSGDLSAYPAPSYRDIPALAIDAAPDSSGAKPPPTLSAEDQEKVEERLKSLGYL